MLGWPQAFMPWPPASAFLSPPLPLLPHLCCPWGLATVASHCHGPCQRGGSSAPLHLFALPRTFPPGVRTACSFTCSGLCSGVAFPARSPYYLDWKPHSLLCSVLLLGSCLHLTQCLLLLCLFLTIVYKLWGGKRRNNFFN